MTVGHERPLQRQSGARGCVESMVWNSYAKQIGESRRALRILEVACGRGWVRQGANLCRGTCDGGATFSLAAFAHRQGKNLARAGGTEFSSTLIQGDAASSAILPMNRSIGWVLLRKPSRHVSRCAKSTARDVARPARPRRQAFFFSLPRNYANLMGSI